MWAAAVGGLLAAWCIGAVWGWGGSVGSVGVVLPLSLIVGGVAALVLGATLTITAHIMLSAKHQVTVRVPEEIPALHSLIAVSGILLSMFMYKCVEVIDIHHSRN